MVKPLGKVATIGDGRWMADAARPYLEPFLNQGYAAVVDPERQFKHYDAGTNELFVVPYVAFSGRTRIQPLRTALFSKQPPNDTTTRVVQFWFEWTKDDVQPFIDPGFQIVVTDGGNDPTLSNYQYVVTGSINSSMAWNRTVETQIDLERRPNWSATEKPLTGLLEGATVEGQFEWDGEWRTNHATTVKDGKATVYQFPSDEFPGVQWRVLVDGQVHNG